MFGGTVLARSSLSFVIPARLAVSGWTAGVYRQLTGRRRTGLGHRRWHDRWSSHWLCLPLLATPSFRPDISLAAVSALGASPGFATTFTARGRATPLTPRARIGGRRITDPLQLGIHDLTDFAEDPHIAVGDKRHGIAQLARAPGTANAVHVVL